MERRAGRPRARSSAAGLLGMIWRWSGRRDLWIIGPHRLNSRRKPEDLLSGLVLAPAERGGVHVFDHRNLFRNLSLSHRQAGVC